MKIIVHMGQGKAGSSALQESLTRTAGKLRENGVYYPNFSPKETQHWLLLPVLGRVASLPPRFLASYGGEAGVVEAGRAGWEKTCEDLRRQPAEVLVLSCEFFIQGIDRNDKRALGELLKPLSQDITPVVYVRHPVSYIQARLQEKLKTDDLPFDWTEVGLKDAVRDTEQAFGRRPDLIAFDRKTLLGADIIHDFATRYLAPRIQPADLPPVVTNVSLSAEALVFMAQRRRELGGDFAASEQVVPLLPFLRKLDQVDPPKQPFTLLPEVADAALRSETGYRWLAETGQLHLRDLDVDRIDGAPIPDWIKTARPDTLFHHDPERLKRVTEAVAKHLSAGEAVAQRKAEGNSEVSEKPKPRIQDLLLRFLIPKIESADNRKTGAAAVRTPSVQGSSQGDRNEDHTPDGNLDSGTRDRT